VGRTTDTTFHDTTILVDGHQYIDCRFINCTINFGGTLGGLVFENCYFEECIWGLVGVARETLEYLALLYSGLGSGSDKLRDVVEDTFMSVRQHGLELARAQVQTDTSTTAPDTVAATAG
jgi:hypothetical protein